MVDTTNQRAAPWPEDFLRGTKSRSGARRPCCKRYRPDSRGSSMSCIVSERSREDRCIGAKSDSAGQGQRRESPLADGSDQLCPGDRVVGGHLRKVQSLVVIRRTDHHLLDMPFFFVGPRERLAIEPEPPTRVKSCRPGRGILHQCRFDHHVQIVAYLQALHRKLPVDLVKDYAAKAESHRFFAESTNGRVIRTVLQCPRCCKAE